MLMGLDKVMTYELQSVEHKEGVKEILDCWFGILAFISFLTQAGKFLVLNSTRFMVGRQTCCNF